jgi:hypothetical protein
MKKLLLLINFSCILLLVACSSPSPKEMNPATELKPPGTIQLDSAPVIKKEEAVVKPALEKAQEGPASARQEAAPVKGLGKGLNKADVKPDTGKPREITHGSPNQAYLDSIQKARTEAKLKKHRPQ